MNTASPQRLIAVCRADPKGHYDWLPAPRSGDITVALEGMAQVDLLARRPVLFDDLQSWEDRSAAELRIGELLLGVREHPAVAGIVLGEHRLIDFAEFRLQTELAQFLRGWTLGRAGRGARELICDPAASPAMLIGIRGGLGLDPATVSYAIPPALPGSLRKRAMIRPVMRALAASSTPERVRVAAVVAGKLKLALDTVSDVDLRDLGVGTMPFPGLDHGNSALFALRRRLPMLATIGPARPRRITQAPLPDALGIADDPDFDRALSLLVVRLLLGAAPELDGVLRAMRGLERAPGLRALLLPSAAYGASRVLIDWAHRRGVKVGAMQHGIYAFREFHGEDHLADMVFSWGEGTAEQTRDWPEPRPVLAQTGVPGTPVVEPRPRTDVLRHGLIATSYAHDTPIARAAHVEAFVGAVAPGLARLQGAGVELEFRTHPNEDPERYRRMFARHGLELELARSCPFAEAVASTDILISSASSVAFEAAALGLPVLLWPGDTPLWVCERHLVAPWTETHPGMFANASEFRSLVEALITAPAQAFEVARDLGRLLARFAQPFDPPRFADSLRRLAE